MGSDYSYSKIFTGRNSRNEKKAELEKKIESKLIQLGFVEVEDEKSSNWSYIMVEENGAWLHLSEFFGLGDDIKNYISHFYPVVDVLVCDECRVTFRLLENGIVKDKYSNSKGDGRSFNDPSEADKHKGNPELWAQFIQPKERVDQLKKVWQYPSTVGIKNEGSLKFKELMLATCNIFEWEAALSDIAYLFEPDGIPGSSIGWLEEERAFTHKHFRYLKDENTYTNVYKYLHEPYEAD